MNLMVVTCKVTEILMTGRKTGGKKPRTLTTKECMLVELIIVFSDIYIYIYIYMQVCIYVFMSVCLPVCLSVCNVRSSRVSSGLSTSFLGVPYKLSDLPSMISLLLMNEVLLLSLLL